MHIFRRIFLSNYWRQESDIWSQASYRYAISWEAFLNPSDSYFLFADFVDFYTHLTYICIGTFFVVFFSETIDCRNLIFGHKLHIGMPYRGKHFWTCQIPTSCLPTLLIFILIEYICSFFVAFFSATIDCRNLIFGHMLHIGMPYCGSQVVFLDPSDSCFLFADLVGFYTHWKYIHIFRHIFLSNYWWLKSDIWSQASYRYAISWEAFLGPSDSYFLFADFVDFYTHLTYICICTFF